MIETIYSTSAVSTGDGREGHVVSDDGLLSLEVRFPKELGGAGGATNPEQMFAAGYGACFHSALKVVARPTKADLTGSEVIVRIALVKPPSGAFSLEAAITVRAPMLDHATALDLVHQADAICPYSNATRGNVTTTLTVVD